MSHMNANNYFSLDDILTTQERLPCKFEFPLPRLGYLDPSNDSEDLPTNTKLDLPYWMARALVRRNRHVISPDLPKPYRLAYREIMSADARVVNLHKLGPYYYAFGLYLVTLKHIESEDILKSLIKTFQDRFLTIMDLAQNAYNEDASKFTDKLDNTEREIFASGQRSLYDYKRWETRLTEKLTTSQLVQNYKKRKRPAADGE